MHIFFGLASAVAFGASDFSGGLASRRNTALVVTLWAQLLAVLVVAVSTLAISGEATQRDVLLAVAAGVSQVLGLVLLYRVLSEGGMGILTTVASVVAAIGTLGWALGTGERLSLLSAVGVMTGLAAVTLATRPPASSHEVTHHRSLLVIAALAGVLFAIGNAFIGSFSSTSGMDAVLVLRMASAGTLVIFWLCRRQSQAGSFVPVADRALIAVTGVCSAVGGMSFFLGVQTGTLGIVGVLMSLAPLDTALLARLFLHQRLTRAHMSAVGLAVVTVAFLSVG